jgi:ABC-type bacteriocin/lantibiotic exporter with double-glycine peptidase domain
VTPSNWTAADLRRRWRQTGGRGRKLRGLIALLAPYRGRIVAMFVALLAATGASLAPAPLAKIAIDDGINRGDTRTLNLVVLAFVVSALVYWGASYAQTYLVGRTCGSRSSATSSPSRSASTSAARRASSSRA